MPWEKAGCVDLMLSICTVIAKRGVVAQICNLPYRRFVIGGASARTRALALADVLQNAILRYRHRR
jgi:hypothetical protein